MNPTLQPRIYTFYFFSLYFHDPPDPPDLPTYLVFFPARLARARMDGRARGVRYKSGGPEGVNVKEVLLADPSVVMLLMLNTNNSVDPVSYTHLTLPTTTIV